MWIFGSHFIVQASPIINFEEEFIAFSSSYLIYDAGLGTGPGNADDDSTNWGLVVGMIAVVIIVIALFCLAKRMCIRHKKGTLK